MLGGLGLRDIGNCPNKADRTPLFTRSFKVGLAFCEDPMCDSICMHNPVFYRVRLGNSWLDRGLYGAIHPRPILRMDNGNDIRIVEVFIAYSKDDPEALVPINLPVPKVVVPPPQPG